MSNKDIEIHTAQENLEIFNTNGVDNFYVCISDNSIDGNTIFYWHNSQAELLTSLKDYYWVLASENIKLEEINEYKEDIEKIIQHIGKEQELRKFIELFRLVWNALKEESNIIILDIGKYEDLISTDNKFSRAIHKHYNQSNRESNESRKISNNIAAFNDYLNKPIKAINVV